MLDFEKELEKFEPSMDIDEIGDLIMQNDVSDVSDLIKEILKEKGDN